MWIKDELNSVFWCELTRVTSQFHPAGWWAAYQLNMCAERLWLKIWLQGGASNQWIPSFLAQHSFQSPPAPWIPTKDLWIRWNEDVSVAMNVAQTRSLELKQSRSFRDGGSFGLIYQKRQETSAPAVRSSLHTETRLLRAHTHTHTQGSGNETIILHFPKTHFIFSHQCLSSVSQLFHIWL